MKKVNTQAPFSEMKLYSWKKDFKKHITIILLWGEL
jgi:hypothetical protein